MQIDGDSKPKGNGMDNDLKNALERLDRLVAEIEGPAGDNDAKLNALRAKIIGQCNSVVLAYRAQRAVTPRRKVRA
jgi:hypothetical protein